MISVGAPALRTLRQLGKGGGGAGLAISDKFFGLLKPGDSSPHYRVNDLQTQWIPLKWVKA